MRRVLAAVITVAISVAVLWTGLRRSPSASVSGTRALPESPVAQLQRTEREAPWVELAGATDHIEGLLQYARRGDVQSDR